MEDYFDPYGGQDDDQPSIVSCKRCGKDGLHWNDEDGQWVLMEGAYKVHKCNLQKAALNDFEDVS